MYPIPLAPGAEPRTTIDDPVVVRPQWQRCLPRRRRLAVIDTHFPWKLSGFRYNEGLEFLRQQPSTVFFSLWPLTNPFPREVLPLDRFPQVADQLGITDAYWVFLGTSVGLLGLHEYGGSDVLVHEGTYTLTRTFSALGIRKHVMLWPGGGMIGRTRPSILQVVGRNVDTVFTNVQEVERAIPDAIYIPLAVDTRFYQRRDRDAYQCPLRLLFAGSDANRKGLGTLLAAFRHLPPDRFRLTIIGPHERHTVGLGAPNVEVVGWASPEQLRDHYWRAHAFVSPATIETQNPGELGIVDGFPTTTGSDAMATGCALVASNPRREHRALLPDVHYFDVRVDDVDHLVTVLLDLEQDRARLSHIALQGAKRVAEFSIERIVSTKLRVMGFGPHGMPRPAPPRIDLTKASRAERLRKEPNEHRAAATKRAKATARTTLQRLARLVVRPSSRGCG
jgi:glycosyltransferase involved in cell wall biosynthesis